MNARKKKSVEGELTEELLEELLEAPNIDRFVRDHEFLDLTLSEYLQRLLEEKSLRRIDVIHKAGLNETFGYMLFTGRRQKASRDKLLALAFAMGLDLKETNRLLQLGEENGLYSKNRRDAIIIYGISHSMDLQAVDEALYRFKEETIS